MPAKYYIIPIDNIGCGYFGVKAQINPYTGGVYNWAAMCPNIFGGNLQGSIAQTLYQETREESHFKIDLNQAAMQNPGTLHQIHQAGAHPNLMTFYAMRGNFTYNPAPWFPAVLANQNAYRETTGEVFCIDLGGLHTAHRSVVAGAVCAALQSSRGLRQIAPQSHSQFLISETAEAIRLTAIAVQNGTI
jgi:hypothetical protein